MSSSEDDEDDPNICVLDFGSGSLNTGLAGEEAPGKVERRRNNECWPVDYGQIIDVPHYLKKCDEHILEHMENRRLDRDGVIGVMLTETTREIGERPTVWTNGNGIGRPVVNTYHRDKIRELTMTHMFEVIHQLNPT